MSFPRELGDPIMAGLSASEFKKRREEPEFDQEEFFAQKCQFVKHQIVIKVKPNERKDNNNKFYAHKVFPFSAAEENQMFLRKLKDSV